MKKRQRIRNAILGVVLSAVGGASISLAETPTGTGSKDVPHQLTVDSTVGELLDNPAARAVLAHQVPAIVDSKQIAQARAMSLRSLQAFAPTLLPDERLKAIDAELAKTPGTLSSASAKPVPVPIDFHAALELQTIPLWEGDAPDARGQGPQDRPTLTVVGTDGAVANGTAVVVAPGGGYQGLASGLEGRQVADWFAAHGITAFVLTYRLASAGYQHPVQLHDAQRAIRWVRAHASQFGVATDRIGMVGFSAGGHLTAMASTLFDDGNPNAVDPVDRVSNRPDFAVLGYPAILIARAGSHWFGLADETSSVQTKRELAPTQNVSARTPPTFIFHTSTDEVVPSSDSIAYYTALRAANVPVEMHIFERGRHGLGLGMTDRDLSEWPSLMQHWLDARGLLGVSSSSAK